MGDDMSAALAVITMTVEVLVSRCAPTPPWFVPASVFERFHDWTVLHVQIMLQRSA